MGVSERREREKEQRRSDIIDAAEKVFFSKSVDFATMDEIAEAVELSKGTLYLYFKSKEEILHSICCRATELLKQKFVKVINSDRNGLEKLKGIGQAYYEFAIEYPDYFNVIKRIESYGHKSAEEGSELMRAKQLGDEAFAMLSSVVEEGIKDGSIRSNIDPLKTAFLLYAMSRGVIQTIIFEPEHIQSHSDIDAESFLESFYEIIFKGLTI